MKNVSDAEILKTLYAQRDTINEQIRILENKPKHAPVKAPSTIKASVGNQIPTVVPVREAVGSSIINEIVKLPPLERVFKMRPDYEAYREELVKSKLEDYSKLMSLANSLDKAAQEKSAEKSAKATPAAPTAPVKPSVTTSSPASSKPAVPLSPLEAALDARPDLAAFKKELEAESKKPGATKASLIVLGNKLDEAKISGK